MAWTPVLQQTLWALIARKKLGCGTEKFEGTMNVCKLSSEGYGYLVNISTRPSTRHISLRN